ncbi:uncharacterized protein LOC134726485 [Mytilus trossulus]|uniref:uncharacterized protein LOC134726485 n=1 Tax=Mytilus trossulus TaxID=6551 RepID=UPI003006D7BE
MSLVVGLVLGGLLLACVIIVIVVLIIRHSFKSKPRETRRKNSREYDYIGSHDLAFPLTANHSNQIQNNVKKSSTTYAVRRDTTLPDNSTLSDHNYSIVDQTAEALLNETRDGGTGTTDSYMILDPYATGYNRKTLPTCTTRSDYEFAKPENNIDDESKFALPEERDYDHAGNNRLKELEFNIYSHAVDNIYDTGSHKRKEEGRENTYDHFFGQKTADENDNSTTT